MVDASVTAGFRRKNQIIGHRDPAQIIRLARSHTVMAVSVLEKLMMGKSTQKTTVFNRAGEPMKVDVPVPPAVQLRAAEILLERGYGKSPQAIMVSVDDDLKTRGAQAVPIMERIAMLRAAGAQSEVTDLEASEQDDPIEVEVPALPAPAETTPAPPSPQDLI